MVEDAWGQVSGMRNITQDAWGQVSGMRNITHVNCRFCS